MVDISTYSTSQGEVGLTLQTLLSLIIQKYNELTNTNIYGSTTKKKTRGICIITHKSEPNYSPAN